jgi:hypothetical protein
VPACLVSRVTDAALKDVPDWQTRALEPVRCAPSFSLMPYPNSSVNGQSYVGGQRIDGKGKNIGGFVIKNSFSNNAAKIEIKTPHTPLLKKYRDGVFGPHEELCGGITQVLEHRYHFVGNCARHIKYNEWRSDNALSDFNIDCILIAGTMPTDKDQRRSFQLYRKNSHIPSPICCCRR